MSESLATIMRHNATINTPTGFARAMTKAKRYASESGDSRYLCAVCGERPLNWEWTLRLVENHWEIEGRAKVDYWYETVCLGCVEYTDTARRCPLPVVLLDPEQLAAHRTESVRAAITAGSMVRCDVCNNLYGPGPACPSCEYGARHEAWLAKSNQVGRSPI